MAIDVGITQGKYWGGAQIPYWLYLVFVIFPLTGLLGLDHLLLRSPQTFLLKLITMVPLFGFWYFYDIAQAVGERELVEKYGIGVPYYGPIGLGAGMFINKDKTNLSPVDTPKPWKYMIYVFVTCFFIAFPLNKLVIGDYWGAIGHLCMYLSGIFTLGLSVLLAIGWGFYDIYRVIFDTRGVFEKGAARVFPATWFMDPFFNKGALGPAKVKPPEPTLVENTLNAMVGVPMAAAQATAKVVGASGDVAAGAIKAMDASTIGLVKEGAKDTQEVMSTATGAITNVMSTATNAVKDVVGSTTGTVTKAAGAAGGLLEVATKLPGILEKISAAGPPVHKGGAIITSYSPSSAVLLFSVAAVAFGGYVLYSMRKTLGPGRNDDSDDSPPDPRTIRAPSQGIQREG